MASRRALQSAREQAALEVFVRTNPEASALRQAILGERSRFISTARAARGSAQGIRALAKAGRPVVKGAYDEAEGTRVSSQSMLDQHLAALGAAATDYKAGSAREAAGQRTRIAEAAARALADLDSRSQNALAGAEYAVTAARSQYHANRGKLETRQQDLAREAGALTQLGVQKALDDQRRERKENRAFRLQARSLDETSRHHRATEEDADEDRAAEDRRERRKNKEKGKLTPLQKSDRIAKGQDHIGKAKRTLGVLGAPRNLSRGEARAVWAMGGIKDKVKTPEIDNLWLSVALDLTYDGHISRANQAAIRRRGLNPAKFGNTKPRPRGRVGSATGAVAGAVGAVGRAVR